MTPRAVVFVCGKDPLAEISGGHSSYVRAHGRAAIAAGYEPHLFCVGSSPSISESGFGVVRRVRSAPPYRQIGVPWHASVLARAIRRAFPVCPVIHSFGLWGWAAVLAARVAGPGESAARTIVNVYTSHPEESKSLVRSLRRDPGSLRARLSYRSQELWSRFVLQRWERRMLRDAGLVVVNYECIRRLLEARYGPLPNCRLLPYCSESALSDAPPAADRPASASGEIPLRILCVARHESRKGISVLLEALARMRRSGTPFRARLIGGGPLLDAHRALARRLGLEDIVDVAGALAAVDAELRSADIFVMPSIEEQSGSLALLEAMQAGVPAAVSGVDGLLEDVEPDRSAVVVPPGDSAALAGALTRLVNDRGLRQRISRNASEVHRRRFAAEHLVEALRGLYSAPADQASPRRQARTR
jgi:glycosyltransferase involved in cell wall biosynthesis